MYTAQDFDKALLSPTKVFESPMEVARTDALTTEQKLEILKRWEAEARDLQVAQEENMTGGEGSGLIDVRRAIDAVCRMDQVSEKDGRSTPGPSKSGA
jgi:hypothetical protein